MMAAMRIGLCACLVCMPFDTLRCQAPQASTPMPAAASAVPSAISSVIPASPPKHLVVHCSGDQLEIDASNAPLKDVLNEISAKAAITITGRIPGDVVFGHYGPSSVRDILIQMIAGTGVNMLFVGHPQHGSDRDEEQPMAGELILSERHGGPDPPNPTPRRSQHKRFAGATSDRCFQRPGSEYGCPTAKPTTASG